MIHPGLRAVEDRRSGADRSELADVRTARKFSETDEQRVRRAAPRLDP
jgi:hypothetical protein